MTVTRNASGVGGRFDDLNVLRSMDSSRLVDVLTHIIEMSEEEVVLFLEDALPVQAGLATVEVV